MDVKIKKISYSFRFLHLSEIEFELFKVILKDLAKYNPKYRVISVPLCYNRRIILKRKLIEIIEKYPEVRYDFFLVEFPVKGKIKYYYLDIFYRLFMS